MAQALRVALRLTVKRAYSPLTSRLDELQRRLDSTERLVAEVRQQVSELRTELGRAHEEQRRFAALLTDIHAEVLRSAARVAALEESANDAPADRVLAARQRDELGGLLS